ncbi:hypothetical protein [Paenibacillus glufosinatiresistens]|uniref:hypothetical protein n=1 Tax=Paenibacillus glufosinatiresistens TaxID=3070657 RepID=UPI00286E2BE1|nr:hypothetical protein [Paenibacillus sp. YX.27]
MVILLVLVLLIGSAAAGSLMVYAKPVRAILVDYSSMNEIGNRIYLEAGLQMEDTLASNLLTQAEAAEDQVAEVFGSRVSAPYLIFAITPKTWNRYARTRPDKPIITPGEITLSSVLRDSTRMSFRMNSRMPS